jgi:hypothetical protein
MAALGGGDWVEGMPRRHASAGGTLDRELFGRGAVSRGAAADVLHLGKRAGVAVLPVAGGGLGGLEGLLEVGHFLRSFLFRSQRLGFRVVFRISFRVCFGGFNLLSFFLGLGEILRW